MPSLFLESENENPLKIYAMALHCEKVYVIMSMMTSIQILVAQHSISVTCRCRLCSSVLGFTRRSGKMLVFFLWN